MSTQPSPQPDFDPTNSPQVNETPLENSPSSMLNLKLEVEKIYRDVDELRKLLQTLVTGLIIAIILSLGISSWFAYRLLLQEQIFKQESDNNTTKQEEIVSNLDDLKLQLQSQNQQLQSLKQEVPENLQQLLLDYQQQIQQLSDRLDEFPTEEKLKNSD
jgi:DNA repair exonuclease SbcCD ATPase subunit